MKLFEFRKSSVIKVIKIVIEVLGVILSIFGSQEKNEK
jgi:hypothetical protein